MSLTRAGTLHHSHPVSKALAKQTPELCHSSQRCQAGTNLCPSAMDAGTGSASTWAGKGRKGEAAGQSGLERGTASAVLFPEDLTGPTWW